MRMFATSLTAILTVLGAHAIAAPQSGREAGGTVVYVGTYTGDKTNSQGIYAFRMQDSPGQPPSFTPLGLAAETASPSFIIVDAVRGLLFAVNEVDQYEGKPTGSISAFSIDRASGKLTLINRQPSMGKAPCHLTLDRSGRHLLVANYSSGTVAVLPVAADGRLGQPWAVQHAGSSVNKQRQEAPHAHCTVFDPAFRFFFACDLGLDKVMAYRLDEAKGTLTAHSPAYAAITPGSGPRHLAFRPDGRYAYVLNELTSTVTAFAYDGQKGVLAERQTQSALPPSYTGQNSGAEIAVHPSGHFLYTSNRGHNSIAGFRIDQASGALTFAGTTETGGSTPRNFAIDPTGRLLFAANQGSANIVVFSIDQATGALKPTGTKIDVPTPVCVAFLSSISSVKAP
jgi:6-phosphogluconolactonase